MRHGLMLKYYFYAEHLSTHEFLVEGASFYILLKTSSSMEVKAQFQFLCFHECSKTNQLSFVND